MLGVELGLQERLGFGLGLHVGQKLGLGLGLGLDSVSCVGNTEKEMKTERIF